ncbi:putative cytochrome P450 monooxygenase [Ilyonectria destructans]|nr:putative cytochrome P450 monooxygenase [Ilyonectria destructans]
MLSFITSHTAAENLSFLALVVLGVGVIFGIYRVAKYRHIPGPWPCRISHHYIALFELFRHRPQTIAQWHRKYGPFVLIAPGQVSISDVTAMRDLYSSSKRNGKSDYFDHFIYHNARSIFAEKPYEEHRRKRALSSAFYQATSIYKPDIQEPLREGALAIVALIQAKIKLDSVVDVFPIINHFAWDNITTLVFGPRHCSHAIQGDEGDRDILARLKNNELWSSVKHNLPLVYSVMEKAIAIYTGSSRFFSAERNLDAWAMQRVDQAMADPLVSSDWSVIRLLQDLRRAGRQLSDDYVACEVIDNLHAAQATVTVALTYVVYHLSRNPEWQALVQKELDDLPREEDGLPVWTALDKVTILEACIRESYRLNPVSSGRAERVLVKDTWYSQMYLPQNTIASASTIALHLDPTTFPEPLMFNPQRWLATSSEGLQTLDRSFIPFGYGARLCLGKAFATLQVKMLVAAIFLTYSTRLDDPDRVMEQWGTQDALPKGLKCKLDFQKRPSI